MLKITLYKILTNLIQITLILSSIWVETIYSPLYYRKRSWNIIPQTKFANTSIANKSAIVHNLYNLGLLPKKENISKSNKSLIEITDPWLISQ